jgi:hypothetical protein
MKKNNREETKEETKEGAKEGIEDIMENYHKKIKKLIGSPDEKKMDELLNERENFLKTLSVEISNGRFSEEMIKKWIKRDRELIQLLKEKQITLQHYLMKEHVTKKVIKKYTEF